MKLLHNITIIITTIRLKANKIELPDTYTQKANNAY